MSVHAASQRVIGVVIPWIGTPNHVRILEGICQQVSPHGYAVVALQAGFLQQERFHSDIFAHGNYQIGIQRMAGSSSTCRASMSGSSRNRQTDALLFRSAR
jgi:hypothetical protein